MKFSSEEVEKKIIKKNKLKKILRTIIYILIIPILIYNISLIVQSFVKKDETPSFFGYKSYVIISGSMEPELNIGDIIIARKTRQEEIEKGDIVSFREGSSVVTHRVVNIVEENGERLYQTKGDNNNVEDKNLVKYSQIEGIYFGKIEKIGNIALILKNKIVIITILFILFLLYYHNINKEKKRLIRLQKRQTYEEERKNNEEQK